MTNNLKEELIVMLHDLIYQTSAKEENRSLSIADAMEARKTLGKLLALINQKEKELKDELFSREQILEILSYLPPLHYTPNALKAVLQEHWNGVLPFYDDEKVKELGGENE